MATVARAAKVTARRPVASVAVARATTRATPVRTAHTARAGTASVVTRVLPASTARTGSGPPDVRVGQADHRGAGRVAGSSSFRRYAPRAAGGSPTSSTGR